MEQPQSQPAWTKHFCLCCIPMQASAFGRRGPSEKEGVLPLGWGSDKMVVSLKGGRSYHPVTLILLSQSRSTVFKQAFYVRLGWLPIVAEGAQKK